MTTKRTAQESLEAQESQPAVRGSLPSRESSRRFSRADFSDIGLWLAGRLREKWPDSDDRTILGWLNACMAANNILFIRTKNAVALAQMFTRSVLERRRPVVRSVFVLAKDGAVEEAANLYDNIKHWAKGMEAAEIMLDDFSDVPLETIKEVLGVKLETRKVVVARLT